MNEFMRHILFLPPQASTFAPEADFLHYFLITVTFVVAGGIFAAAGYFVVRYRRTSPSAPTPKIEPKLWQEVLYIGTPLVAFTAWFWMGFHDYIWVNTPPPNAMEVYVTAKQWMWKFSYPDGPNTLNVLRVPAGRPVRLLITSRDVIHSFFVPAFRIKQDAVPGRYTEAWFEVTQPGVYRVMCTEYCGLNHSRMWAEVIALEPAEYDEWLEEQKQGLVARVDASTSPEDAARGESVMGGALPTLSAPGALGISRSDARTNAELMGERSVVPWAERPRMVEDTSWLSSLALQGQRIAAEKGCFKCHTVDGSPHIGPTWLDLYNRVETLQSGRVVKADEAYLTKSMMDPGAEVVAGFLPVMPSFQGQLDPAETAALLEFIKMLRSDRLTSEQTRGPIFEPRER